MTESAAPAALTPENEEQFDVNEDAPSAPECPFCVMMRKGGCEAPFQAFMECGERADKGNKEMSECLPTYEALHACMEKNKVVFDALLEEMRAESEGRDTAAGGTGSSSAGDGSADVAAADGGSDQQQRQQQEQAPAQQQHEKSESKQ